MRLRSIFYSLALLWLPLAPSAFFPDLPASVAKAETPEETKQRAEVLDQKFGALRAVRTDDEAAPIVAEIWELWRQSGRAEIDELFRQGIALLRMGAQDPALVVFDEVIKRAPDFAEGWNSRATLLYMMGEYDRSLADCEEVLKHEPRHFGALAGMGMIQIAKDDYKAALAAYRRALAVNPHLLGREIIEALERQVEGQKL